MAANMAYFVHASFAGVSFPESFLSAEYPEVVMLMHEQCFLWTIDAEYLILKFQSKMANRWQNRGFPILNLTIMTSFAEPDIRHV